MILTVNTILDVTMTLHILVPLQEKRFVSEYYTYIAIVEISATTPCNYSIPDE